MHRREILKQLSILGALPVFAPLLPYGTASSGFPNRLFFDLADIPRIRRNCTVPLLKDSFSKWSAYSFQESLAMIEKPLRTKMLLTDFGATLTRLYEVSLVHLVSGTPETELLLRRGLEVMVELPAWDYILERGERVGIMRASKATTTSLFILEVLHDSVPKHVRDAVLTSVAEKGAMACDLAIRCMDDPDSVEGWTVDEVHKPTYPYDMSKWPGIFDTINLRAVPTMGLGLGALALQGVDSRADEWLERAINSSARFLSVFKEDGSYWEGISYVDYALRTLFFFLNAYDRVHGDKDWSDIIDWDQVVRYISVMDIGMDAYSGLRDVVNFSDARVPLCMGVNSWLRMKTHSPLAQYNTNHFSRGDYLADFLWYDSDAPESPPDDSLLNVHLDLDWVIARSSWNEDAAILAFRSGPPANHEHADRNHFIFKYRGERLLTDPFGASYNVADPHWLLRLTEAHNAVLVNGEGHQYVDGSDGTNAGLAAAKIVFYEDKGSVITWTSEATNGYQLINSNITLVRRTVCFAKPDIIILLDEVHSTNPDDTAAIRFHPDNRDNAAGLDASTANFTIRRPLATLHGAIAGSAETMVETGILDLPSSYGEFPFVQVSGKLGSSGYFITVLQATEAGMQPKSVAWEDIDGGTNVRVGDKSFSVIWEDEMPVIRT